MTVMWRDIPTQKQLTLSFMIEPIQIQVDNVNHETEVYVDLMTASDVKFEAKVDTGAQANIMPVHVSDKIVRARSHFRPSTAHLQGYRSQILQNEGIAMLKCRTSASDLFKVSFYITKEGHNLILGLQTSHTFNIIKIVSEVKTMDGVTHMKQMGCLSPEDLEPICRPGVTDNNGIGRTIETPVDDRNGFVRKDIDVSHSSKGHTESDSRMHGVSRQAKHRYNYRKLSHKWKDHLPLSNRSGDAKQDLM